ncbi:MAG: hypothetical protein EOP42_05465 [Sphingobacteriaceae bacterium]|nr:MAG: hypothetical protein EOP42_05465 [Sphingobacteriaceae bacterium]
MNHNNNSMLILKLFLKYISVISFAGLLGGILNYYLHFIFFDILKNPPGEVRVYIYTGIITGFITCNLYKFLIFTTPSFNHKSLLVKAAFCYTVVVFLSIILGLSTFGYNFIGFLYISISLGFSNFLIPYLDYYADKFLKLNSYQNI